MQSSDTSPLFEVAKVPCPPSLWQLHRRNGSRTPQYNQWLDVCKPIIKAILHQKMNRFDWIPLDRPVALIIAVDRVNQKRDLDNYEKALIDLLVKTNIMRDDNIPEAKFTFWRAHVEGPASAYMAIYEAGELPMLKFTSFSTDKRAIGGNLTRLARPLAKEIDNGSRPDETRPAELSGAPSDHHDLR